MSLKFSTFKAALFATALLPLVCANTAFAQSNDIRVPQVFIPPPVGSEVPPFVPAGTTAGLDVSDAVTQSIARQLQLAQDFCRRIPADEYTVDCLGDALEQIAEAMPTTGDYAEAQAAIAQAARRLRALARENASPDLPVGVFRSTGTDATASSSPLTPVRTETLAQTNAAAIAIIAEAETILLRSAENSATRKVHYEQIAQAVGSNTVLLRSL
jgi:hypothetical protein